MSSRRVVCKATLRNLSEWKMVDPIYETAATRTVEDRIFTWAKPLLVSSGIRRWGSLVKVAETPLYTQHDRVIYFERGAVLLEVKCRSVKYDTFMISESKINAIKEAISRMGVSQETVGMLLIGVNVHPYREVWVFDVNSPTERRFGGRDDRGASTDREMCLFYSWDRAVYLGQMSI